MNITMFFIHSFSSTINRSYPMHNNDRTETIWFIDPMIHSVVLSFMLEKGWTSKYVASSSSTSFESGLTNYFLRNWCAVDLRLWCMASSTPITTNTPIWFDSISGSFPSAEAVIATVRTNMYTRLYAKKGDDDDDTQVVALLHSHHLLDHKSDNLILKGSRHELRGVACLGRPGVALCIGSQRSISKFRASLESAMPQKRFKTKILFSTNNNNNHEGCAAGFDMFEQAILGELREHLASIDEEVEFFSLTGIAAWKMGTTAASGNKEMGVEANKRRRTTRSESENHESDTNRNRRNIKSENPCFFLNIRTLDSFFTTRKTWGGYKTNKTRNEWGETLLSPS